MIKPNSYITNPNIDFFPDQTPMNTSQSGPVFPNELVKNEVIEDKTTSHLHPGTLIIRRGEWLKYGRCVNALIEPAITDMSLLI